MTEKVTSVGQVYAILQQALKIHNTSSMDVWAKIFKTDKNNPKIFKRIDCLFVLFSHAKKEIAYLDKTQDDMGLDTLNPVDC